MAIFGPTTDLISPGGGGGGVSPYRPAMRDFTTHNFYPMNIISPDSSLTTVGLRDDKFPFTMIPMDEGMHISRIGVNITTAVASSYLQVGIYSKGADQFPDELLFETTLPAPTTTGDKEAVVDWTIPAGNFFYMVVSATTGVNCSAFGSPEVRTAGLQGSSSSTFLNSDFKPTLAMEVGNTFPPTVDISANPTGNRGNTPNIYFKDIA